MHDLTEAPLPFRRERACPFDPAPEYRRLREREPVARVPMPSGDEVWLVTRYADVREVLGDPARFTNNPPPVALERPRPPAGSGSGAHPHMPGNFAAFDPPEHTRYRRMLAGHFTVKRIGWMRERIEQIVADRLEAMEKAGPGADLVQDFAFPVPSLVICELLGVPHTDRDDFQRRSSNVIDLTLPEAQLRANLVEMLGYMHDLVARQRKDPGEGILGALVREHGAELTDIELLGVGNLLLLAGHEPAAIMLALGPLLLLQHPEQAARLREDPELAVPAVEELLRYLSVVYIGTTKTATRDVSLGGREIKAGEYVMCALPSANRDEALLADPDGLDLTRRPSPHVAFGYGPHQCLGQQLARMELRIAIPALLRKLPTLRLAVPFEEIEFRSNTPVHGVHSLPVTW